LLWPISLSRKDSIPSGVFKKTQDGELVPAESRAAGRSPAQQGAFGCPPCFQTCIGLLLLLIGHHLLARVATLPYARFRRERRPASPTRFRDRLVEGKDPWFLGQKIRIVKFAMTHKQAPNPSTALGEITHPTLRRPSACLNSKRTTFSPAHAAGCPVCGPIVVPQRVAVTPLFGASPHKFPDRTATIATHSYKLLTDS